MGTISDNTTAKPVNMAHNQIFRLFDKQISEPLTSAPTLLYNPWRRQTVTDSAYLILITFILKENISHESTKKEKQIIMVRQGRLKSRSRGDEAHLFLPKNRSHVLNAGLIFLIHWLNLNSQLMSIPPRYCFFVEGGCATGAAQMLHSLPSGDYIKM
jgi:hypothetical protein